MNRGERALDQYAMSDAAKLPPVVETFSDGTNFHGAVKAFYSQFAEGYQWRDIIVWSHKDPDVSDRWLDSNVGELGPPVNWILIKFSGQVHLI